MSRIFITGSEGYLGTRFIACYSKQHEIRGIDKNDADITDRDAIKEMILGFRPDLVIHAAAVTATDFSNQHPDLTRKINVFGAQNVVSAAAEAGADTIFLSTEQVFNGNTETGPYTEASLPCPDTMYGITKLEAEKKLRDITDRLWILRLSWLFGLPEHKLPVNPNILWNALQIAARGKQVAIPTNEYRGVTYGYDMIDALMRIPSIPFGTYHIGSQNNLSRYEITRHILMEFGLEKRIDDLIARDDEKYAVPRDIRLDTSSIAAEGISFEDSSTALKRAIHEFGLTGAFA